MVHTILTLQNFHGARLVTDPCVTWENRSSPSSATPHSTADYESNRKHEVNETSSSNVMYYLFFLERIRQTQGPIPKDRIQSHAYR